MKKLLTFTMLCLLCSTNITMTSDHSSPDATVPGDMPAGAGAPTVPQPTAPQVPPSQAAAAADEDLPVVPQTAQQEWYEISWGITTLPTPQFAEALITHGIAAGQLRAFTSDAEQTAVIRRLTDELRLMSIPLLRDDGKINRNLTALTDLFIEGAAEWKPMRFIHDESYQRVPGPAAKKSRTD